MRSSLLFAAILLAPVSVTLQGQERGVRIVGRVTGSLEKAQVPRRLRIAGPMPSEVREIPFDANGRFEMQHASPGTYIIEVSGLPASLTWPRTVVVGERDLTGVEIPIPAQVEIRGEVVIEGTIDRAVAAGMIVNALRQDAGVAVPVERNGSFKLEVAEGEHRISLKEIPAGYRLKSAFYRNQDVTTRAFTVSRSDAKPVLRITLEPVDQRSESQVR